MYYTGDTSINSKYQGLHEKMEVNIDAIIYKQKTNQNLKDVSLASTLLPRIQFSKSLKQCIDNVFKKTFSIPNMGTIYEESYHTGNTILKYFVTDKTGIKKEIYKIKDALSVNSKRKYQYLSFHVTRLYMEYLNEQKETWYYPINNTPHKESFLELYTIAKQKTISIINDLDLYFQKKITKEEILKKIGNNSYITGIDCNNQESMKYFKF